jgi:hypothetical protein
MKYALVLALAVLLAACSKKSPTGPTPGDTSQSLR